MTISPAILKQMKDGSLATLRLSTLLYDSRPGLDHRDYQSLSDFIAKSRNLREIDFSMAHGTFESLSDGLKQNCSVTKINLSQMIHDHSTPHLVEVLRACPGITQLVLDESPLQNMSLTRLSIFLRNNPTMTHLSLKNVGVDPETGMQKLDRITNVLKNSPNILSFLPAVSPEITEVCATNRQAVLDLLQLVAKDPQRLSVEDIAAMSLRLPAMLHIMETESNADKTAVATMLVAIEDTAHRRNVDFLIPERYAEIASTLPRPFYPSKDSVDFTQFSNAADLGHAAIYKAVEAGQVNDLMDFMQKHSRKFSVEECLHKPDDREENMVQLMGRQGKLDAVMNLDNWSSNPRGFSAVAATLSGKEWQRQMKEPVETMLSQLNAISFKTPRLKPQQRPGL